jgi:hypothetical protein
MMLSVGYETWAHSAIYKCLTLLAKSSITQNVLNPTSIFFHINIRPLLSKHSFLVFHVVSIPPLSDSSLKHGFPLNI